MQKYFDINESGYSIRCKLYCNDVHAIKKAVIFGHGFGGHKDNKAAEKFAAKLISKHREFCVVTFNWQGKPYEFTYSLAERKLITD